MELNPEVVLSQSDRDSSAFAAIRDEPKYDELYEENLTLLDEREALTLRIRLLEQQLTSTGVISSNESLSAEIERLQSELGRRANEVQAAHSAMHTALNVAHEAKSEVSRLEAVLAEKDDRLRDALKGVAAPAHSKQTMNSTRNLARQQVALELKFAAAVDAADTMKGEVSTLKSQIHVLEQAVSAAAAEKDDVQLQRARDIAALDVAETQREEMSLLLEEANDTAQELRAERDRLEAEVACLTAACSLSTQVHASATDLPTPTVQRLRAALDETHVQLEGEKAENSRLDAENVELAALADFLRLRIDMLCEPEVGTRIPRCIATNVTPADKAGTSEGQSKQCGCTVDPRTLKREVARLEDELDDTRELLALAAEHGELGTPDVIRRNMQLKAQLREINRKLEDTSDMLASHRSANDKLKSAIARYKTALRTCRNDQELTRLGDPDHSFDDLQLSVDMTTDVSGLESRVDLVCAESDELQDHRYRLARRPGPVAVQMSVSSSGPKTAGSSASPLHLNDAELVLDLEERASQLETARKRDLSCVHSCKQVLTEIEKQCDNSGVEAGITGSSTCCAAAVLGCVRAGIAMVTSNQDDGQHTDSAEGDGGRDATHVTPLSKRMRRVLEAEERSNAALAPRLDRALNELAELHAKSAMRPIAPFRADCVDHQHLQLGLITEHAGRSLASLGNNGHARLRERSTAVCASTCVPQALCVAELSDLRRVLAHTLEALDACEAERVHQEEALAIVSGKLAAAQQHMTFLYDRFGAEVTAHASKVDALEAKVSSLLESRYEKMQSERLSGPRSDDTVAPGNVVPLMDRLVRKHVSSLEGNEMMIQRRYRSIHDALSLEVAHRHAIERAACECEAAMLERLTYLELWKLSASARMDSLEAYLDSVDLPVEKGYASTLRIATDGAPATCVPNELCRARVEVRRAKAIAAITAAQSTELLRLRDEALAECDLCRRHWWDRKANADVSVCIGKLQRELVAAKSSQRRLIDQTATLRRRLRHQSAILRLTALHLEATNTNACRVSDEHRARMSALHATATSCHRDRSASCGVADGREQMEHDGHPHSVHSREKEKELVNLRPEYIAAHVGRKAAGDGHTNFGRNLSSLEQPSTQDHHGVTAYYTVHPRLLVLGDVIEDLKDAQARFAEETALVHHASPLLGADLEGERRACFQMKQAEASARCRTTVTGGVTRLWSDLVRDAHCAEVMLLDKDNVNLTCVDSSLAANAATTQLKKGTSTIPLRRLLSSRIDNAERAPPPPQWHKPRCSSWVQCPNCTSTRLERSRLTHVASQTIKSLRAVVAEKNRIIEILESRLEAARETASTEHRADWARLGTSHDEN
mmetsp:Transcript_22207/g.69507  ORF Transcript_22207/g.69507 Transcript_22207/m.69507 type:complete len:1345 (-) Transcript_22207:1343-5377(-)